MIMITPASALDARLHYSFPITKGKAEVLI